MATSHVVKQKHRENCTRLFSLVVSLVVLLRRGLEKQGGCNKCNISKINSEIELPY
jgi:hypothetical protein